MSADTRHQLVVGGIGGIIFYFAIGAEVWSRSGLACLLGITMGAAVKVWNEPR